MTADSRVGMEAVDVVFVIYNYTSKMLLKKQIDFFRGAELSFSYSLVAVDDASIDGSRAYLDSCPEVRSVFLEDPEGAGRAFNRGLAKAPASRYLCFLQTDVVLNAGALERLVAHGDAEPGVKVLAPVICFPGGQPQKFVFQGSLASQLSGSHEKRRSKAFGREILAAKRPVRVAGIVGPFLFCAAELAVGGTLYDEEFHSYFYDQELAHRLADRGVVCEVLPDCSLVRLGGQSSFIRDQQLYYSMKYRYVATCYGPRQARSCLQRELFRARCKLFFDTILNRVAPSSKLTFHIVRYGRLAATLKDVLDRAAHK